MPAIKVLDPAVVGRIAAGEVVERPQSAVKELIENCIDAGATAVTVEIKDGGITSLRVTDNGCGIPAEQVLTAFQNHATSKLREAEQLDDIRTLGFRGEALPSIAAVARVELVTRTKGAPSGIKCVIDEAGRRVTETGCPEGTTITVKDLFYNTPVRRTFLKKPAYEASLIKDTMEKMILAEPGISFRFISGGKQVFRSYGDGDILHAAYTVYGQEVTRLLRTIDVSEGAMRIKGFVGLGELSRPTRAGCLFFINGRIVRAPAMQQALEEATEGLVPRGSYPMCALSLTLAPGNVDVNVHPNKLEVRFRDEEQVLTAARDMLKKSLETESALGDMFRQREEAKKVVSSVTMTVLPAQTVSAPLPKAEAERDTASETKTEKQTTGDAPVRAYQNADRLPPVETKPRAPETRDFPKGRENKPDFYEQLRMEQLRLGVTGAQEEVHEVATAPDITEGNAGSAASCRVIGTLFRTYILVETEDAMVMIDQHAAHERLQYERYKKRLDEGNAAQMLLVPLVLRLTPSECQAIEENRELLAEAGYITESFGEDSVRVLSVPHIFGKADARFLLPEVADRLGDIRNMEKEARLEEVMRYSCHRSVKAGDSLNGNEIAKLLETLRDAPVPPNCPHGRPIFRVFPRREIEKEFGRVK